MTTFTLTSWKLILPQVLIFCVEHVILYSIASRSNDVKMERNSLETANSKMSYFMQAFE